MFLVLGSHGILIKISVHAQYLPSNQLGSCGYSCMPLASSHKPDELLTTHYPQRFEFRHQPNNIMYITGINLYNCLDHKYVFTSCLSTCRQTINKHQQHNMVVRSVLNVFSLLWIVSNSGTEPVVCSRDHPPASIT